MFPLRPASHQTPAHRSEADDKQETTEGEKRRPFHTMQYYKMLAVMQAPAPNGAGRPTQAWTALQL